MGMNTLINHYIQQLKDIQTSKNWVGNSYESVLKGLEEDLLFIRPKPDMHSVANIYSHVTFWREETILKIKTGKGSKSDDAEENWIPDEKLKQMGWEKIKTDYDTSLDEIIELLKNKEDSFLQEEYYDTDFKGSYTYSWLMDGMVHHDLYHLGQLGMIVKQVKKLEVRG